MSTNTTVPPGIQTFQSLGIHTVNVTGLLSHFNVGLGTLYQEVSAFSVTYGGLFLVVAGLVWLIAWKFRLTMAANWCKRVISGVFLGELIIVLLPQVFYSFVLFLSHV
ncbi:hypothetical protein [Alicyclobacillus sp. SP_1]|uniref:hypothetical protein n=1 Tax=Alicyclobacillus sp. SP_1 TaxID=2942475 RepID=UPI00215719E0|nr:hypothetical protein [Alicyclobacillus sp. SP_1]